MLVSLEWIKEFVDLGDIDAKEIAEKLSRTGLEVEGIINYGEDLNNLVVGYVDSIEPHPDSDHLQITYLQDGTDQLRQVVCGAPNIAQGQKIILALPGAVLPGDFEIKVSEVRGVASFGMICSLQELGISESVVSKEYAKGIFVLPQDAPIGADIVDYLKLDDPVLDIDLTPNRADALSMLGNAYELGAILDQKVNKELLPDNVVDDQDSLDQVTLKVASEDVAPAYELRLIKDVTVAESPLWLQVRLMKAGIRPINNIVDVTNYYLLEYGQPMHAFDYDELPTKEIRVDYAKEGNVFKTLDDVERKLTSEDVMIYSGDTPIAMAGVMGGLDSEVTYKTRNVLLETAVFNPINVRRTSKRFGLRSESSARFEKGVNHSVVQESGDQAAQLIADLGQGQRVAGAQSVNYLEPQDVQVTVKTSAIKDKLGLDIEPADVDQIMSQLGFGIQWGQESFVVSVPPRRWDIMIEADILEEIARIYGFDNIPTTIPVTGNLGALTHRQRLVRHTRQIAEGMGLNQVISYALTSEENADLLKSDSHDFVNLKLPMSEDRSRLRQSMFPALVEIAQYNQARQNQDLAFYEQGRVFLSQGDNQLPIEEERLAILLSGEKSMSSWYQEAKNYDFYDLKGMLETYFQALRIDGHVSYQSISNIDIMHPGRTADVLLDGQSIGFFGQIHPKVADKYDLSVDTFFAELDFDALAEYRLDEVIQTPIPRYPSTSRDIALLVDENQLNQELIDIISSSGTDNLKSIHLFDYYAGERIEAGKKSLAYHLVFQNPERTLQDKDIDPIMARITEALLEVKNLQVR